MSANKKLIEFLKPKTHAIFGLFDGAIVKDLWLNVDIWGLPFDPLYEGEVEKVLEAVPYLIRLDYGINPEAVDLLFSYVGKKACLFMQSEMSQKDLLKQLRYFYHGKDNNGQYVLRRFYDPRVFEVFLKTMSFENKIKFFSGVDAFFSESISEQKIISFRKEDNLLVKAMIEY
jgi:hypothetical protein